MPYGLRSDLLKSAGERPNGSLNGIVDAVRYQSSSGVNYVGTQAPIGSIRLRDISRCLTERATTRFLSYG